MRVIFMGTPDFAVGTLEEIVKQDMKSCWLSHSRIKRLEEARH